MSLETVHAAGSPDRDEAEAGAASARRGHRARGGAGAVSGCLVAGLLLLLAACQDREPPRKAELVELAGFRLPLPPGVVAASGAAPDLAPCAQSGASAFRLRGSDGVAVCYSEQRAPCAQVRQLFDADAERGHDAAEFEIAGRRWMRRNVGAGHAYEWCEGDRHLTVLVLLPPDRLAGGRDPFLRKVEESLAAIQPIPSHPAPDPG